MLYQIKKIGKEKFIWQKTHYIVVFFQWPFLVLLTGKTNAFNANKITRAVHHRNKYNQIGTLIIITIYKIKKSSDRVSYITGNVDADR